MLTKGAVTLCLTVRQVKQTYLYGQWECSWGKFSSEFHALLKFRTSLKSSSLLFPLITILSITFGRNWIKLMTQWTFKTLKTGNIAKCTDWPHTERRVSDMKSTIHTSMHFAEVRIPNFHQCRSTTISGFEDIAHFRVFPLTSMLKLQSATTFVKLGWIVLRWTQAKAYMTPW